MNRYETEFYLTLNAVNPLYFSLKTPAVKRVILTGVAIAANTVDFELSLGEDADFTIPASPTTHVIRNTGRQRAVGEPATASGALIPVANVTLAGTLLTTGYQPVAGTCELVKDPWVLLMDTKYLFKAVRRTGTGDVRTHIRLRWEEV
jgi:hypothetical protein